MSLTPCQLEVDGVVGRDPADGRPTKSSSLILGRLKLEVDDGRSQLLWAVGLVKVGLCKTISPSGNEEELRLRPDGVEGFCAEAKVDDILKFWKGLTAVAGALVRLVDKILRPKLRPALEEDEG
jgi:hypothetical protein